MKKNKFTSPSFLFVIFSILAFHVLAKAQEPILDKENLLKQNHLYQILDFTPDGHLIINEIKGKRKMNDARFSGQSQDRNLVLSEFLVGKFIRINDILKESIELPVELYNPLCFSSDPSLRAASDQCPVILER